MQQIPHIYLKKSLEREVLQGFPWVYNNQIENARVDKKEVPLEKIENGSVVEVFSFAGLFLGLAVLNKNSVIALRLFAKIRAQAFFCDVQGFWNTKIQDAYNLRLEYYKKEQSFRLVFAEADGLPGFIAEHYVDKEGHIYLLVQFLSLAVHTFRKEILHALRKVIKPYGIYERSVGGLCTKEGLKERSCFEGEARLTKITIKENGIFYNIDLANGQKTGHFLDQANNRATVAKLCKGKTVLDAFCHTGGFGLCAAKAGAKEITCADISADAIEGVKQNALLNDINNITTVVCDVFDYLRQCQTQKKLFDVIILDPPAFAPTAKSITKAYSGYKQINLCAIKCLKKGGLLVSCSCSYYFNQNTFCDMLLHAACDCGAKIQITQKLFAAPDHPVLLGYPQSEYLKCVVARVL